MLIEQDLEFHIGFKPHHVNNCHIATSFVGDASDVQEIEDKFNNDRFILYGTLQVINSSDPLDLEIEGLNGNKITFDVGGNSNAYIANPYKFEGIFITNFTQLGASPYSRVQLVFNGVKIWK